jgi:hypothetical protein
MFLVGFFLLSFHELEAQTFVPTFYTGFYGHNYIGHLGRGYGTGINMDLSIDKFKFVRPQITLGFGLCESNLSNKLFYFPVGAGLSFGKQHFRIKPAIYLLPIFGKVHYWYYTTGAVDKSFTYAFSGELLFQWYGKKGFYTHLGVAYKYMPRRALPVEPGIYFIYGAFNPSIGVGYTLTKGTFAHNVNPDSVSDYTRRNVIGIELFGSNFFDINSNNVSMAAVSYTRWLFVAKQCFQVGLGISVSQGKSYDQAGGKQTNALLSIPSRLLWRMNYKRNGLWFGFYVTPAFGKQHYLISTRGGFIDSYKNFNLQGGPELSYQFHSRNDQFLFAISVSAKIMNAISSPEYGSSKILPVYGGISIGRAF